MVLHTYKKTSYKKTLVTLYVALIFSVLIGWGSFNMYVNMSPKLAAPAPVVESIPVPSAPAFDTFPVPAPTPAPLPAPVIKEESSMISSFDSFVKNPMFNGLFIPLMLYLGKKAIDLLFEILEKRILKKKEVADGAV